LNVDWRAAELSPTATITDVAIMQDGRVFSGYEYDPMTFEFAATLFFTVGYPGSQPVWPVDLGFTTASSISLSLSSDGGTGLWAAATEDVSNFETRSYIFHADYYFVGPPTPVVGPGPGNDPNVLVNAINKNGQTAGHIGQTLPLISNSNGLGTVLPYPNSAVLFGVDSLGSLYGGEAELTPGGTTVAVIFDAFGGIVMLETEASRITDVEGTFAVGQRNGVATYWHNVAGTYQAFAVEDGLGVPQLGELQAIDHNGSHTAGGTLDGDHAIVVLMRSGRWFDLDDRLGLPAGTLGSVVGIDSNGEELALAVQANDFAGWDVTAQVIPGPGAGVIVPLLITGWLMVPGNRARETMARRTRNLLPPNASRLIK
jgi:hypothetical protein